MLEQGAPSTLVMSQTAEEEKEGSESSSSTQTISEEESQTSRGTGTTIEVNSRFHRLMPRDDEEKQTVKTMVASSLTEREAVRKYLLSKVK